MFNAKFINDDFSISRRKTIGTEHLRLSQGTIYPNAIMSQFSLILGIKIPKQEAERIYIKQIMLAIVLITYRIYFTYVDFR